MLFVKYKPSQNVTSPWPFPNLFKEDTDVYFPGLLWGLQLRMWTERLMNHKSSVPCSVPNKEASHPPLLPWWRRELRKGVRDRKMPYSRSGSWKGRANTSSPDIQHTTPFDLPHKIQRPDTRTSKFQLSRKWQVCAGKRRDPEGECHSPYPALCLSLPPCSPERHSADGSYRWRWFPHGSSGNPRSERQWELCAYPPTFTLIPQVWGTIKWNGQLGQVGSPGCHWPRLDHCPACNSQNLSHIHIISTVHPLLQRCPFPWGPNIPLAAGQGEHFLPELLGLPLKGAPAFSTIPWSESKRKEREPVRPKSFPTPPAPRVKVNFLLLGT